MKEILIILLVLLSIVGISQNVINDNFPTKDGYIFYQEVIEVDSNMTENDIYIQAKKWITSRYISGKAAIEVDDKQNGIIIVKSFIEKGHEKGLTDPKVWYVLEIEVKKGRYRLTLNNLIYDFKVSFNGFSSHTSKPFEDWMNPPSISPRNRKRVYKKFNRYCDELNNKIVEILDSLIESIEKKNSTDDW